MSLIDRQQQLRLLLELEPIVWRWSIRLGKGDTDRIAALRRYFLTVAEARVGLIREVRRGWIADVEVLLVVDEYAESLRAVRRPVLSPRVERDVAQELAATIAKPQNSLT